MLGNGQGSKKKTISLKDFRSDQDDIEDTILHPSTEINNELSRNKTALGELWVPVRHFSNTVKQKP